MFFLVLVTLFTAHGADFPECENFLSPVDTVLSVATPNVEEAKKTLFKLSNDKRLEVLRYVRSEKESFRKIKDSELLAFDVETKKNKNPSSDERNQRRKGREELVKKTSLEKKEFNKTIDEKQKTCNTFLNTKRTEYFAKFRKLKSAPISVHQNPNTNGAQGTINEFDDIPKGPGTVLKPQ